MIVPFAAGGPTDILGRIVAQAIGPMLGQQVIVEDITGAGGTIGADQGRPRRARRLHHASWAISAPTPRASASTASLAYDPRTDFEPVILVASHADGAGDDERRCRVNTLDEVIA